MADTDTTNNHAAFIWSVADLLRGDYKQSEYGKVILPLTVLRRLDCVLAPTKAEMLAKHAQVKDSIDNFGPILDKLTDIKGLWNTSKFDLAKLVGRPRSHRRQPAGPYRRVLPTGPRHHPAFRPRHPDQSSRQGQAAVSRDREVHRDRPPPGQRLEHRDGLPVRGADPPLLGALQ